MLLERYTTKADGPYLNLPIVVLVNQYSASAAEIVAACLQDDERAAVAGQRSFGKGTVQQLLPIGKGLLKLTWASFWRPNGANIHRTAGAVASAEWGVTPTAGLVRELTAKEYEGYAAYRKQRDGDVADASEKPADKATGGKFVDEQLQLAVEYLRSHFLEKNPLAKPAL